MTAKFTQAHWEILSLFNEASPTLTLEQPQGRKFHPQSVKCEELCSMLLLHRAKVSKTETGISYTYTLMPGTAALLAFLRTVFKEMISATISDAAKAYWTEPLADGAEFGAGPLPPRKPDHAYQPGASAERSGDFYGGIYAVIGYLQELLPKEEKKS